MVWVLTLSEKDRGDQCEIQPTESSKRVAGQRRCHTNRPGETLVLGDVSNVERLHGVFDVLGVHVVNLTDVAVPAET